MIKITKYGTAWGSRCDTGSKYVTVSMFYVCVCMCFVHVCVLLFHYYNPNVVYSSIYS